MSLIGFIGAGNMAEALIKGIITSRLVKPANIIASDIRAARLDYLRTEFAVKTEEHNKAVAARADILILAVKPQNMSEALESIKDAVRKDTLLISIAAGIKVAKITAVLGDVPIVRVMPNTPALIGEGASALFANEKAKPRLAEALKVFKAVGRAVVVENEDLMDAVTAVSGSGPAYYLLLTEQIIKAAVELGLPEDVAGDLVLQTARGAALLAAEADKRGETPAELRKKVTSPGGTTEAAMKVLAEGRFDEIMVEAVKRACQRSREMSGCPAELLNDYRLGGAFVGGLLDGIFAPGRNLNDLYLCHIIAHLKDLRTGINTQSAGRAGIFYPYIHNNPSTNRLIDY